MRGVCDRAWFLNICICVGGEIVIFASFFRDFVETEAVGKSMVSTVPMKTLKKDILTYHIFLSIFVTSSSPFHRLRHPPPSLCLCVLSTSFHNIMYTAGFLVSNPVQLVNSNQKKSGQVCRRMRVFASSRGPTDEPPSYRKIDANPLNALFTRIFRLKLEKELGRLAVQGGYDGVIETVKALAVKYPKASELQLASERVLLSLFPGWLPPAFAALFSRPLPSFAAWINAIVTVGVTQWLMGPSSLDEDGTTVNIERCRYLEGKE